MVNYTQLYLTIINLFCLIFVGFLLRKFKIVDENTMTGLNKLIFNVLFPVKIMMSFYNVEFGNDLSLKYFVYLNVMFLFHIFLTFYFSKITNEDKSVAVLEANGMSRGNFIIMSFPILSVLFGDKGIVMAGAITGISQFFYNFYTVSMYESLVGENNSNKTLLINVFKTPLMIGLFVGIFLYVTKINIFFLETSLKSLGDIAGTLALVTMGYGLNFRIDFKEIKSILKVSVVKLLVLPLTGLFIGKIFGLSEIQKVVALILFGAPTAVNTYVFAKRYRQDDSLAGYYVVSTTILYLFTLLLLIKLI
ncbi:MAG: AEC family transporter [Finegoldia magna]|uniref:AEC family transporter n=1 Tax=Finegoldia magna TaxID=1260 RepID=UPI0025DCDA91|nr:AEC family transporter [Finegoldia magna]MBS5775931.1 AEC family transporter [Finegoldia magna]MDU2574682.1 AEC family transporter [Finegoldia magna]MDU4571430.1 AEC family transporter [Finegoldia magna]MDU7479252.1 AEC family transporter [Finegoldia magna]